MAEALARDVRELRRALAGRGDTVEVSVSREAAELFARVVDARVHGGNVFVTKRDAEVTPNQAADLLGVSRPQVRKMMDAGALEFRMVGSHHRIQVSSIQAFLDAERPRRARALMDLADLQNELGLTG